jgi:hypothetical protein
MPEFRVAGVSDAGAEAGKPVSNVSLNNTVSALTVGEYHANKHSISMYAWYFLIKRVI